MSWRFMDSWKRRSTIVLSARTSSCQPRISSSYIVGNAISNPRRKTPTILLNVRFARRNVRIWRVTWFTSYSTTLETWSAQLVRKAWRCIQKDQWFARWIHRTFLYQRYLKVFFFNLTALRKRIHQRTRAQDSQEKCSSVSFFNNDSQFYQSIIPLFFLSNQCRATQRHRLSMWHLLKNASNETISLQPYAKRSSSAWNAL